MRLTFQVRYGTRPGQSLLLTGNHELLGNGDVQKAVPLDYLNDQAWQVSLMLADGAAPDTDIVYNYILRETDGSLIYDWGNDKIVNPAAFNSSEVLIIDAWNHAGFFENAFYTEPFKDILLKANHTEVSVPVPAQVTHTFKVKAPLLEKGQTLCLLGNRPALGNWSALSPILLSRVAGSDFLTAQLDLSRESFPIAYKYGVYDIERRTFIRYEDGNNRVLSDAVAPGKQTSINDGFALLPANTWKGAGVAIPVFSLRSEKSFGVGEFTDLKLLADWCKLVGLKLIQVLPVNDTIATHTWMDSYPYSAISAFALHPLYLNLSRVANQANQPLLAGLDSERKRLNALDKLDFEAVIAAKMRFIRQIYPSQKQATFESKEYRRFFERNKHWLVPYAVFCFLRDKYGTADFSQWPAHRRYVAGEIAPLLAEGSPAHDEIALNYFIQYYLHLQLHEASEYAHAQGVILKGDIAIGVYRHGTDPWQQPELYHTEVQAGAPPDAFAVKGQNWGFPTYNWPRMKETGFAWWKQRFAQMGHYFDAFRVDHILGFFRIWSIPMHAVEGILGYFVPAIPVHLKEFANRAIRFDRDRFTRPYITEEVLRQVLAGPPADPAANELAGQALAAIKTRFVQSHASGGFALRSEFATQRQVEHYFAAQEQNALNDKLKLALFDLISNVILLEAEGAPGQQFHFRFAMENTLSFKHLDPQTQAQLKDLYIDYFFRRQDDFWMKEALQKLPALKRVTNMLICGEDLGLVPACVPVLMKQLGLLSLEIQRMPKAMNQLFFRPKDAPYLSVVTPSTHDMSTIRGWWKEDRNLTQQFFNQELGQPGRAPDNCKTWINRAIVLQHLASPAMWSIFQLQDLLGIDEDLRRPNPEDERINVPADPRHYWRHRLHLSLEALLAADSFNDELRSYVQQNGR